MHLPPSLVPSLPDLFTTHELPFSVLLLLLTPPHMITQRHNVHEGRKYCQRLTQSFNRGNGLQSKFASQGQRSPGIWRAIVDVLKPSRTDTELSTYSNQVAVYNIIVNKHTACSKQYPTEESTINILSVLIGIHVLAN